MTIIFLFLQVIFIDMKSPTKVILFVLTAVLLFAFTIQQLTGLFKFKELNGVTYSNPKPELTWNNFIYNDFQTKSEAYLQQHSGFHEPLTRLYNQTVWTFFRYSQVEEKKRIMITKDNWIFEPWTVEEYYQSCSYKIADDSLEAAQKFEAEAKRLYQLQHVLEPYRTKLFVAMLPGKELICGENMPPNTLYFKKKKITAFDFYSKRFNELGVNHVNFGEWFMQMKDTVSYPLFPQTGTHWSNLAAIHVADSLVNYLEVLGDINMHNIELGSVFQRTLKPDADLESLMNLIWPLKKTPNFLTQADTDHDSTAVCPILLTIGDSYYWNILNFVPVWNIFESVPYWYYFSTAFFDGDEDQVSKKDLVEKLVSVDFVMLSYGTTQLYRMSDGFSLTALLEFCYDPDEIEAGRTKARKDYENDTLLMAKVKRRARQESIPWEKAIDDEFEVWLKVHCEDYFPALRDSIPSRRSLKVKRLYNDALISQNNQSINTNP